MIVEFAKKDPDNEHEFIESESSRRKRQRQLGTDYKPPADVLARRDEIAAKRAARLDRYFSSRPPNGPLLAIFRDALARFKNANGSPPNWLTYEHLEASFARLEKRGILTVEVTTDSLCVKTVKSEVTKLALANRRKVRPAEFDTLIQKLKEDIGSSLQQAPITGAFTIRGCRQVTVDRWRVSFYFGGAQRALGCWPLETAVRLQDVLAFHFSSYRRPSFYNTSESEAKQLLASHPAIATFCAELEKLWLDAGVLTKPGIFIDKTEQRLQVIETRLSAIEEVLKAWQPQLKITP